MKLGPRSKLDMRSTLTSKKLNDNVFSKNYDIVGRCLKITISIQTTLKGCVDLQNAF